MPLWHPKQAVGVVLKRALMWHDAHGTKRCVPVNGNPVGSWSNFDADVFCACAHATTSTTAAAASDSIKPRDLNAIPIYLNRPHHLSASTASKDLSSGQLPPIFPNPCISPSTATHDTAEDNAKPAPLHQPGLHPGIPDRRVDWTLRFANLARSEWPPMFQRSVYARALRPLFKGPPHIPHAFTAFGT